VFTKLQVADRAQAIVRARATVDADIVDVLAEGDQTALGLARFLTEVEFDFSKSVVVLVEPVSLLDACRRSRVPRRLVELGRIARSSCSRMRRSSSMRSIRLPATSGRSH
jgi:wobble nucleotide-excising tRNase